MFPSLPAPLKNAQATCTAMKASAGAHLAASTCRICLQHDRPHEKIWPCPCTDPVHREPCLQNWREQHADASSKCFTCGAQYELIAGVVSRRAWMTAWAKRFTGALGIALVGTWGLAGFMCTLTLPLIAAVSLVQGEPLEKGVMGHLDLMARIIPAYIVALGLTTVTMLVLAQLYCAFSQGLKLPHCLVLPLDWFRDLQHKRRPAAGFVTFMVALLFTVAYSVVVFTRFLDGRFLRSSVLWTLAVAYISFMDALGIAARQAVRVRNFGPRPEVSASHA